MYIFKFELNNIKITIKNIKSNFKIIKIVKKNTKKIDLINE